jgi:5-methylcytosine-specific restriction endonuclease McrA
MNALDSLDGSSSSVASPADLSDGELLTATRRLVGRSNQLLAALLGHLAEVEARGLHRNRACSSLYNYCIYELRFSEDEAFRRVAASRLVRRFPALLDAVASGELHLTGLLMLGPHLTTENLTEVLARAKHRTKKEIARLVRRLDPLPDVPPRIEPLGPAPARIVPPTPTWSQFAESLCPVRELVAGDRPREWIESTELTQDLGASADSVAVDEAEAEAATESPAPARLEPERYRVQFTAGEEFVKLVERAQALLSHSAGRVPLDDLALRAMRVLVAELEREKRSARKRRARAAQTPANEVEASAASGNPKPPRQRGRRVPAAVRRVVFERDQSRCAYLDDSGQRCRETHHLELHHLKPFAKGGEHTLANLALRCRAHNALAAEHDFGADFIQHSRDSARHESERRQPRP